jgi:hypothetical protein
MEVAAMAEIRNYTINFGCGRAARLTSALPTLACAEIDLRYLRSVEIGFGKVS